MNFSAKPITHKDMDFKITLGIYGAKDKTQAEKRINEMLDAYDLHNFSGVEINWMEGEEGEVKPLNNK